MKFNKIYAFGDSYIDNYHINKKAGIVSKKDRPKLWIEQLCINQSLEKETVKKSIKKFNDYINLTNDYKPNLRKYKSHFVNWIKYNIKTIAKSSGSYQWKWKGQAVKNGSKKDLEKDKKIFDKPGFEFKILKHGN